MSERFWPKWELVEWSAREHSPLGEGFLVFRKLLLFACSEAVISIIVRFEKNENTQKEAGIGPFTKI